MTSSITSSTRSQPLVARDGEPVRGDKSIDDRIDLAADVGLVGHVEQGVGGVDHRALEADPDVAEQRRASRHLGRLRVTPGRCRDGLERHDRQLVVVLVRGGPVRPLDAIAQ